MRRKVMRRRICAWRECGKLLPLRSRSDAIFCPGNRCNMAARRAEKRIEAANRAFKVRVEIADNAHADRGPLEFYRGHVVKLHFAGIEGAECIATPKGILVVEKTPGAFEGYLRHWRATAYQPGDPDLLALIHLAAAPATWVGGRLVGRPEKERGASFPYREAERKFMAAAAGGSVASITLFTSEPQSLPPWSYPDDEGDGAEVTDSLPEQECREDNFDPRDGDVRSPQDRSISDWLDAEWNDRVTEKSDS